LTVDKVKYESSSKVFHLRIPNLELKAALAQLLLSLKDPFLTKLDVQKQATTMQFFLINMVMRDLSWLLVVCGRHSLNHTYTILSLLPNGSGTEAGQGFEMEAQVGD
jgi:hypothetical protein